MDNSPAPDVSPQPSAPPSPEAPSAAAPAASAPATNAAPVVATPVPQAAAPTTNLRDNVSNIKDQAIGVMKETFTGGSVAITSLLVGASVAFLVAFVLYWIITRGATPVKKTTYLVPESKVPKTGYEVNQINGEGIPSLKNEATVSFWLYVNEFPDVPTNPNFDSTVYRHVWHRGDARWSPETVTPLVLIKSTKAKDTQLQSNSLIFSIRSSNATALLDGATFDPTTPSLNTKINYIVASRGIVIDYIPVKRWVHVAITMNKKTKLMKAFVDGEHVKTVDNATSTRVAGVTSRNGYVARQLATSELNGNGDIYVGGRASSDVGMGFSGLVSNIRYSNWDMANYEVYREYKRGPVENVLSRMGLPAYGVQSPIYKIL